MRLLVYRLGWRKTSIATDTMNCEISGAGKPKAAIGDAKGTANELRSSRLRDCGTAFSAL